MDMMATVGRSLTPKNVALGVMVCDMVGRPLITMSNKEIPLETRKTIAVREFFTELLGATLTYGVATTVEKSVPQMLAKKLYNVDLTKALSNKILESEFKLLSPVNQKLRGIILLSSFLGTILAASILTPIINNVLTNKVLNKFLKKADHHGGGHNEHQTVKTKDVPQALNSNQTKIPEPAFSSSSNNFQQFLLQYQANKAHAALNLVG